MKRWAKIALFGVLAVAAIVFVFAIVVPSTESSVNESSEDEAVENEVVASADVETVEPEEDIEGWTGRTEPENLDLAVRKRSGEVFYVNDMEWGSMSPALQRSLGQIGLVIGNGEGAFVLSLTASELMTYDEASKAYKENIPTREQADMILQYAYAVENFDGFVPVSKSTFWTRSDASGFFASLGLKQTFSMENGKFNDATTDAYTKHRVWKVTPLPKLTAADEIEISTPRNLDIAIRRNGVTSYYGADEWKDKILPDDEKLGMVIMADGQEFILSLDVPYYEPVNWTTANCKFGNKLPTLAQAKALVASGQDAVDAFYEYGGVFGLGNNLWTSEMADDHAAYMFNVKNGELKPEVVTLCGAYVMPVMPMK